MDELIRGSPEYEIRLYTFSLIRTSSSLWERQEIHTEVQKFFIKNCTYEWKPKEWHKITQKVFNLADSCGLVATIMPNLKDAIVNTGKKMFEWIMYVYWELGLDVTHALPILWTPLGFVDEVRIFKSIWVNDASLYVGSPDKPIFRIACMLAQEDFIREHESEMIRELKKLPMAANLNNVDLEVVNYPDKVYGIMSTYVNYLVNQDSENKDYYFSVFNNKTSKEELEHIVGHQLEIPDFYGDHLKENMEKAITKGMMLPPDIMAKLCGCLGLLHGIKYYAKKLNGAKEKEVNDQLRSYFCQRSYVTKFNHYCRARKYWEISALIAEHKVPLHPKSYFFFNLIKIFLRACPLESVLWPIVENILNNVETIRPQLNLFLSFTFDCMIEDYKLGIANTRYFYQKLLKNICATFCRRKMRKELELISAIQNYCWTVSDFTMLRTAYSTDELIKFEGVVEFSRRRLFWQFGFDYGIPNFEIFEKFFDQIFDCPDDRIRFVLEVFHECHLLLDCDFDNWEKLFSILDMPLPLRDSIDPMKCLCSIGCDLLMFPNPVITNVERCDKFIKWWHKSNEEDQKSLKEKFKESPYLSECIYKLWNDYSWNRNKSPEKGLRLLQWLFDSEYEISKFKKEKLSILGLLDTSLTLSNASFETNKQYERIFKFLIFSEATAESIANEKDEIRSKIEELICKYLTFYNIETFDFLMNWVSVSEEVKKRIFRNLMESSKILKLCDDVANINSSGNYLYVFYNEWVLKYCEDISKLKRYLLSKYKGLRSETYMAELSSMYERLERGERLEYIWNPVF